jgi:hypothetical protein
MIMPDKLNANACHVVLLSQVDPKLTLSLAAWRQEQNDYAPLLPAVEKLVVAINQGVCLMVCV